MSERDDGHDDNTEDTVDTEATVLCPYCGELNDISLDPGSGPTRSTWRTARSVAGPGWYG
jgi:hypothetical protein